MGFFDGLKRDTKQARTVEEVDRPQTQEQEVVVAEEELVDDPENIEVVVREVEDYAAPVIPQEPLKSYLIVRLTARRPERLGGGRSGQTERRKQMKGDRTT